MTRFKHWPIVALLTLLAFAWAIYHPGLSGIFLLDDYQNLKTLERINSPVTFQSLVGVVLSNPSGDTGRALAMLTFAAQYASWPDAPSAFKALNVLIHLTNAALLFILVLQLGALNRLPAPRSRLTALLATAAWLLHPMHVSTVLYAVQRMTMLSCFFTLAGLIGYLAGRKIVARRASLGYLVMSVSLAVGGGLGLLCKENAVLLPLYALILEFTLLRNVARPAHFMRWQCLFLGLPLALIVSFFAAKYSTWILPGYTLRDFSPTERLLTEARAVIKYLGLLLLPRAGEFGLFHDDFALSRSLFSPPSTFASLLALALLMVSAIRLVKRLPAYGFAVLVFLGGHLLESTFIPLELYFEHRNYFPAAGLLIGLSFCAQPLFDKPSAQVKEKLLRGLIVLWLVVLSATTWNESRLWGNPVLQAHIWAKQHPHSERAQLLLATNHLLAGNYDKSIEIYKALSDKQPATYIMWASMQCTLHGKIVEAPYAEALLSLQHAGFSKLAFGAIEQIVNAKEDGNCPGLSTREAIGFLDALLANPNYLTRKPLWLIFKGRLLIAEGAFSEGLKYFDDASRLSPNVELALLSVKAAAQSGDLERAERYLHLARESNTLNRISRFSYEQDIKDWQIWLDSARIDQRRSETRPPKQ